MNSQETELLLEVTKERSVRAIALRAGFDPSTLTRQLKSGIKAETVIDVARAYGLPVVQSLVKFGFVTESEAVEAVTLVGLETATDEQLAQEILNRVKQGSAGPALTDPVDVDPQNVVRLDDHRQSTSDELAVASVRGDDDGEDGDYDA